MIYQEKLLFPEYVIWGIFPFFFFSEILQKGQEHERKKVKTKRLHNVIHKSR